MKLDRHTASQIKNPDVAMAILNSVTTMAEALGVPVTAVGLENAAQVTRAQTAGCAMGQGFHFSPPLPAAELAALLNKGNAQPAT
jgi:EAL domain-containing protein (putative c-di-GMP-specific phosphodiesterase class I)